MLRQLPRPSPVSTIAIVWLASLLVLIFAAPLAWLVREWQDNPYYEHGPLVPLISLVLVALAMPDLLKFQTRGSWVGAALIMSALLLRVLGAVTGSEFVAALALPLVLMGLAAWWLGRAGLRAVGFPVTYLLLAIPLPFMDDLGFYFQRLSTALTTISVRLIGVPATYQGAEVSLPSASFIVGVQCSGLYSTMTLLALGLLFVRMLELRSWQRKTLLIAAIPIITVVSNVFRLSSLLWLAHERGADFAMTYYHNLGDVVFWLLAMLLLFLVGKGFEWTQAH
ncbi:MAG: exosortase/archaeosortase family protein [Chloroflexi bacterium]|nr:exosortase/archaeosortase family protein [Chloroflexota bacterium]